MSLTFLIGAIIGSGVTLVLARDPVHRAYFAFRARQAKKG